MSEDIKRIEILSKIKNQLEELNDYQIELEAEISKSLYIDNSIKKAEELEIIKKSNDDLISQLRALMDTKIDSL